MSKILFLRSRTHTRVGIYYFVMAVAAIAGFSGFAVARTSTNRHSTNLRSDFLHPPAKYRTYVWWHWMGLTISQYGIKRDLTAMKKAGVAGATICLLASQAGTAPNIANSGVPAVHYWSPKFWRMVAYAVKIAKRLHLKLGMENCPGWSASGGPWIPPALSMKKFVWTMTSVKGPGKIDRTLQKPPIVLHVYHDICVLAVPVAKTVQPDRILNISTDMNKKGVLTWHAPAGMWHIYRYGYTSEGTTDHPVPDGVHSLEADKLSAKAATFQIEHVIHALQSHLGRSIGHTFTHVLFDSYEAGPQTWTGNFRRDFIALRHYDPLPWLPALNGVVVGSRGQSQRFIYDFTRTIEQEFRRNDFDVYHRLIDAAGLKMCLEPYHGPFNSIACAASCDVTMGEFWNHSRKPFGLYASAADRFNGEALRPVTNPAHRFTNIDTDFAGQTVGKLQQFYFNRTRSGIDLDVAGAARADGRKVVGSETLTGAPWDSRMTETPASLKPELDGGFLSGVNRCYLHDWTLQALNKKYKPGILMGCFGTHFGENQTWFKPGIAFFTYINRCCLMLQQGSQVCNVCTLNCYPTMLSCDALSLSLFKQAAVKHRWIVLPTGRSYAVLILPHSRKMLPWVAEKLKKLIAAGATVIGPRPTASPSLTDYPQCDDEVARIGREVWGHCNGRTVREHKFGKGMVAWNVPVSRVLGQLGIAPDFELLAQPSGNVGVRVDAIHRQAPGLDIYFVVNRNNKPVNVVTSFHITGKIPELWYPDSGKCMTDGDFSEDAGRTNLPLQLGPYGSVFVVFRHAIGKLNPAVAITRNGEPSRSARVTVDDSHALMLTAFKPGAYELTLKSRAKVAMDVRALPATLKVHGPWKIAFTPGWGAPSTATFNKLISWTNSHQSGIKYFSGTGTYLRTIDIPNSYVGAGKRVILHLGRVNDLAQVWVNGHDLGVLWHPPFRMDITSAIQPGHNVLRIAVTNTWQNRLIGDDQQPSDLQWGSPLRAATYGYIGRPLVRFPGWVIHNAPQPSKKCYTFETWNFYRKDSRLHPSGLLGPVKLTVAATLTVPKPKT